VKGRAMTVRTSDRPCELEPMYSSKTLSTNYDIPMRTLRRLIAANRFPRPDLRLGRQYRWRKSTVEAFLATAKP
jgi:excisionase family DNA binding protein